MQEDLYRCQNCKHEYDVTEYIPLTIIRCLHKICSRCLKEILNNTAQSVKLCPLDKTPLSNNANEFPKDDIIWEVLVQQQKLRDYLLQAIEQVELVELFFQKLKTLSCVKVSDLTHIRLKDLKDLSLPLVPSRKLMEAIKSKKIFCKKADAENEPQISNQNQSLVIKTFLSRVQQLLLSQKMGLDKFFNQKRHDDSYFNSTIEAMKSSLNKNTPFPFEDLAYLVFRHITRMESLDLFLEKIQSHMEGGREFPIPTTKMLIVLLLNNCTPDLRLQLVLLLSQYSPLPMLSLSLSEDSSDVLKYNFMPELYWVFKPMPAVLCMSFGPGKQISLINKLFGTNFEDDENLNYGSVDIQFDFNFIESGRGFSVLRTDDVIQPNHLTQLSQFSNIFLFIVNANNMMNYVQQISEKYNSMKSNSEGLIILVIQGAEVPDSSSIEKSSDIIKSHYNLTKLVRLTAVCLPEENSSKYKLTFQRTQRDIIRLIANYIKEGNSIVLSIEEFRRNFDIRQYDQEIQLIDDFMDIVKAHADNFFDGNLLPMYKNYLEYCRIGQKIANDTRIWQDQDTYNLLSSRQSELEFIMKDPKAVKIPKILDKFIQILYKENTFVLLYAISKRLKTFTFDRTAEDKKNYFILKGLQNSLEKSHDKSKIQDQEGLKTQITMLSESIERKSLSLEIIWRELIQFYCFQREALFQYFQEVELDEEKGMLKQVFSKYTLNGLPFEVIDGDNIKLSGKFMTTAIPQKHKNLLVVSIIGPQSSGKSTLLNYLFGCQFSTSSGRCTKGVYGTIFDCSFNGYDGLLILDTEGLFATEKQDTEYDKKIVLFCMAVSHIVLINVRGDIHRNMKEVLGISLNALNQLNMSKVPCPTIFIILNQNADPNIQNHLSSIHQIFFELRGFVEDFEKMLQLSNETLVVLSSAFSDKIIYHDSQLSQNSIKWITLSPSDRFGSDTRNLFDKILIEAEKRPHFNEELCPFKTITQWNHFAQNVWTTIENFKKLIRLNEIKEMRQKETVNERIIDFIKKELESEKIAKSYQEKLFQLVQEAETKDQAHIRLRGFYLDVFNKLKTKWEDSLKEMKLTPTIKDQADYLFEHHLIAKRTFWGSIVSSQFDIKEMEKALANGNTLIKAKIESILKDLNRKIDEKEAIQEFRKLFAEITFEMKKKRNLKNRKSSIKQQVYRKYHTLCKSLPEINFVNKDRQNLLFDQNSFCEKNDFRVDLLASAKLNYLNVLDGFIHIDPCSKEGARIICGLKSVEWKNIFNRLNNQDTLKTIFQKLDEELFYVGLGLTNQCFIELSLSLQLKTQPVPKNNWFTFRNFSVFESNLKANLSTSLKWIDITKFKKNLEECLNSPRVNMANKEPGIWGSIKKTLQNFSGQSKINFEVDYVTYRPKENTLLFKWLINSISEKEMDKVQLFSALKEYACKIIDIVKLENLISSHVERFLKDTNDVYIPTLNLIRSGIAELAKELDAELSKIALGLTFAGRGKLHEFALFLIIEIITKNILRQDTQYIETWKSQQDSLEKFFLSQVLRSQDKSTDQKVVDIVVKILEQKLSQDVKLEAQKQYNAFLEENKYLFTRDSIQNLTDAFLTKKDEKVVAKYILAPISIFEEEFEREWKDFIERISHLVLKSYRDMGQTIDQSVTFLEGVLSQLKGIYARYDEYDLFQIKVGTMKLEMTPEEARKLHFEQQQAKLEAPFRCLALFIQGGDYKNFKINQIDFEAKLSLTRDEILKPEVKSILSLITNDNYRIYRLDHFVDCLILSLKELSRKFKKFEFYEIGLDLAKDRYRCMAIGCTQLCPICKRICDATHGNKPGDDGDKHQCKKGHQYCGMGGVKMTLTRKACLKSCNDQSANSRWRYKDVPTTWGEMKTKRKRMLSWDYDILPTECSKLNGKLYNAWKKAGKIICEHYGIIYHEDFS